ncbi:MAG: hybrid sensor histidine kinase/response regulator [Nitrospirota bacterium]
MAFDMKRFIARFVDEAREHIGRLNDGLIALERSPDDAEVLNAIFRSAHTIKGSSRMLKLAAITDTAHKLEDALGALRDKRIAHSRELADLLFMGVDAIADMVEKISAGQEIAAESSGLCEALARVAEGGSAAAGEGQPSPPAPGAAPGAEAEETRGAAAVMPGSAGQPPAPGEARARTSETVRINAEKLDDLIKLMGEMVSNQNRLKQRMQDIREAERSAKSHLELIRKLRYLDSSAVPDTVADSAQALHMQIRQLAVTMRDDNNVQNLLIGELQERALIMRMVPLSMVFDSFQRMVRDIARSLAKEADLVIEGGDIELDKKMMEKIGDPLVHMLRNAVDHGIERPEDRVRTGKPARGVVKVSACYDAGSVIIEIGDDGSGIPLDKIKEKALKKKLFTDEELNAMDEASLIDLVFQPGFSTSSIVTDVSGRGVGMDVVKRNIVEDLKGSIAVRTSAGAGTTFSIRLPLSLAIMPILLVTAAGTTVAVATHYVREIIRIPREEFMSIVDRTAVRLRNEFIPVADLASLLRLPTQADAPPPAAGKEPLIIVIQAGSEHLGLLVDALIDEEDMVIKSLPSHMRTTKLVSGVTISGRNDIINILHIPAIFAAAKEARGPKSGAVQDSAGQREVTILVVDDSVNTREIERSILESYGYRVTLAEDGLDALEKAKGHPFDAVITDVEMPRLDGFSLTELLRKEEAYRHTPIVIVTSLEKEEDKKRGVRVGADAYIVKGSFDQTNLLETVQNLLG